MDNIFGDSIPNPVGEELTKPNFELPDLPLDNVEEEEETDDLSDMFSDEIAEHIEKAVEGEDLLDNEESIWVTLQDIGGEALVEMFESAREASHTFIYNNTIYKAPSKAKPRLKELSLKRKRSDLEQKELEALMSFVENHDELRGDYMKGLKYSDKHRQLMIKMVEKQVQKFTEMGKGLPMWLVWTYLLLVPEFKMASKMFTIKSQIPTAPKF